MVEKLVVVALCWRWVMSRLITRSNQSYGQDPKVYQVDIRVPAMFTLPVIHVSCDPISSEIRFFVMGIYQIDVTTNGVLIDVNKL